MVSKYFCQLLGPFWCDVTIIADMGNWVLCLAVSVKSEYEDLVILKVQKGSRKHGCSDVEANCHVF